MENEEIITKLFDPRMAQILIVQAEVMIEIRASGCGCGPCAKMRACLDAAESVLNGDELEEPPG